MLNTEDIVLKAEIKYSVEMDSVLRSLANIFSTSKRCCAHDLCNHILVHALLIIVIKNYIQLLEKDMQHKLRIGIVEVHSHILLLNLGERTGYACKED
jgi:hypothetical protein